MDILNNLKSYIPSYEIKLPVSNKTVSFTPFKVKDAKNLAVILEEKNKKLALKAMVEILKNNSSGIEINDLSLVEAEFLFLKIRSKSIDEVISVLYENKKYKINIDDIICKNNLTNKLLKLNEIITIDVRIPCIGELVKLDSFEKEDLYISMIDKVIIKNEVYSVKKYVPEEIKKILENLPLNILKSLDIFLEEQPKLIYNLKLDSGEIKEVSGTLDFFTYR